MDHLGRSINQRSSNLGIELLAHSSVNLPYLFLCLIIRVIDKSFVIASPNSSVLAYIRLNFSFILYGKGSQQ